MKTLWSGYFICVYFSCGRQSLLGKLNLYLEFWLCILNFTTQKLVLALKIQTVGFGENLFEISFGHYWNYSMLLCVGVGLM